MLVVYHKGALQDVDLKSYCSDIEGLTLEPVSSADELVNAVERADILMLNSPLYTPALLERLKAPEARSKFLQFSSAGYDTADILGVPKGVRLSNGASVWAPHVAEHTIALLLGTMRAFPYLERERAASRWAKPAVLPRLAFLDGAKIGLVGFGTIGKEIGRRLKAFNTEVHALVRRVDASDVADHVHSIDDRQTVLPELDALVACLPLSNSTMKLIDASWFAAMKKGSIFVNVGRGAVVDEEALVAALSSGHLASAGLDVFAKEPLDPESPLWSFEDIIITPHVASNGGKGGLQRLLDLCRTNILTVMNGGTILNEVVLPER